MAHKPFVALIRNVSSVLFSNRGIIQNLDGSNSSVCEEAAGEPLSTFSHFLSILTKIGTFLSSYSKKDDYHIIEQIPKTQRDRFFLAYYSLPCFRVQIQLWPHKMIAVCSLSRESDLLKWSDLSIAFIPSCATGVKWPSYKHSKRLIYFLEKQYTKIMRSKRL